jgi:hypothetical protein
VAIGIFAKLVALLLSGKSYCAVVPSIFGFPRIVLGRTAFLSQEDGHCGCLVGTGACSAGCVLSDGGGHICEAQGRHRRDPGLDVGTPVANVVRGIQPPGQPSVIRGLSAEVKVDGRIHVEGPGLLLAGGKAIGTNGGQSVFATLICGALRIRVEKFCLAYT